MRKLLLSTLLAGGIMLAATQSTSAQASNVPCCDQTTCTQSCPDCCPDCSTNCNDACCQ